MIRRAALFLFAAVAVSLQSVDTSAQPKPGVPPVPPPQYPTLTTPASLGAKLGATTELMLIGTNLTDAVAVLIGADGVKATIATRQPRRRIGTVLRDGSCRSLIVKRDSRRLAPSYKQSRRKAHA